ILDGYAHAIESLIGRAIGSQRVSALNRIIRYGAEVSGITALALAIILLLSGPYVIPWITEVETIKGPALTYLRYASLYVFLSFAAFHLDGIFIGATCSREMRNSVLLALTVFIGTAMLIVPFAANHGLWLAFIVFVIA